MNATISNMDNTIDSRDIIERIEELQTERAKLQEELDTCDDGSATLRANVACKEWENKNGDELAALISLQERAEGYADDWTYGAQLIRDSYFKQAMDEMIEDCYGEQYSKDLPSFMTITLDYEALQQDYTSVEFDGVTYFVR